MWAVSHYRQDEMVKMYFSNIMNMWKHQVQMREFLNEKLVSQFLANPRP